MNHRGMNHTSYCIRAKIASAMHEILLLPNELYVLSINSAGERKSYVDSESSPQKNFPARHDAPVGRAGLV